MFFIFKTERLLAASNPSRMLNKNRPHTLFGTGPLEMGMGMGMGMAAPPMQPPAFMPPMMGTTTHHAFPPALLLPSLPPLPLSLAVTHHAPLPFLYVAPPAMPMAPQMMGMFPPPFAPPPFAFGIPPQGFPPQGFPPQMPGQMPGMPQAGMGQ